MEPIELTGEMLIKLGFTTYSKHVKQKIFEFKEMTSENYYVGIWISLNSHSSLFYKTADDCDNFHIPISHIQYLHELRRTFFVLFGKELDISKLNENIDLDKVAKTIDNYNIKYDMNVKKNNRLMEISKYTNKVVLNDDELPVSVNEDIINLFSDMTKTYLSNGYSTNSISYTILHLFIILKFNYTIMDYRNYYFEQLFTEFINNLIEKNNELNSINPLDVAVKLDLLKG